MTRAARPTCSPREALERFVASPRFLRLRPVSRASYAFDLARLVAHLEGAGVGDAARVRLGDLRRADEALRAAGVGDAARARAATAARTFLRWAVAAHVVPRTVVRRRRVPRLGPARTWRARPAVALPRDFAARFRAARTLRGLTAIDAARALDVHRQAIARWEAGACLPRPSLRARVLEFLEGPPVAAGSVKP